MVVEWKYFPLNLYLKILMKNNYPKIKIEGCKLSENSYISPSGVSYSASALIQHCRDNKYTEFDLPLAGISLAAMPWDMDDIQDFIYHVNRVNSADEKYPILLDNLGTIADGWHRIVKAILSGKRTIRAIRMESMPPGHKDQ